MIRNLLLGTVALGLIALAAAEAQVNVVPQVGMISSILRQNTYSAISIGLVPAASATDFLCLNGSTTKNVHLRRIVYTGTAGTAITTPVILKLNHSLDTGGTAATGLALPVAAPNDPNSPAATVTLTAYTANPTVTDTSPNYLMAPAISYSTTTTESPVDFLQSGSSVDMFSQGWNIPKAATVTQQLCLNLNGVTVTTGVFATSLEWTED